jgi:predicted enzyme related to lactoylglutathione lyase
VEPIRVTGLATEVLFAGCSVGELAVAVEWYEGLFGRPPDIAVNDDEVMWRIADGGWVYLRRENQPTGPAQVGITVPDVAEAVEELRDRGVIAGPIESVGTAGWKAPATDPDGNVITLIEVAQGEQS